MRLSSYIWRVVFIACRHTHINMYIRVSISMHFVNASPPSAAYMRQWTGLALVQIMARRLFGTKPLSKPMLGYCQLDPYEYISVKFESRYKIIHSRKCIWKYHLPEWWPSCPAGDELMHVFLTFFYISALVFMASLPSTCINRRDVVLRV